MKKYRKKPVVVSAIQYTGENLEACLQFANGNIDYVTERGITIETLEGAMVARVGDYIIRGVNGEYYPCKPDVFEKTYEEVSDE